MPGNEDSPRLTARQRLAAWLDRPDVRGAVIGVIVLNAIVLGIETSDTAMATAGSLLSFIDRACLVIFVIEIALKVIAHGWRFFTNAWNVFDAAIVGIAMVPSTEATSALRALRILRVLRVVSVAPRLRRVVTGFVEALPGMGSVFLLMALIFYIGAVIATRLYGETFPEWFGTLGQSAYSLFQIMTLESWSMGIVRPVMETHPTAWVFFVPFIMLTTFAVVNLLVGLIVNSMQDAHSEEADAATSDYRHEVLAKLDALEARLARMERDEKP